MTWLDRVKQWIQGTGPVDALVIGAGATGLTSALFRATNGVRTRVLEQRQDRPSGVRSAVLTTSTLEEYDHVGLQGVLQRASHPFGVRVMDLGASDQPLEPRLGAGPGARILPYDELVTILEEECWHQEIPIFRGRQVLSVHPSPTEAYAVLTDGSRDRAPHLVLADGRTSAILDRRPSASVAAWSIGGLTHRDALGARLAERLEFDVTAAASSIPLRFEAQADDPADDDRIAWYLRLVADQGVASTAVDIALKQEQVTRAVRTLQRVAPGAVEIVQAAHRIAVHPLLDAPPGPVCDGRITSLAPLAADGPAGSFLEADRRLRRAAREAAGIAPRRREDAVRGADECVPR